MDDICYVQVERQRQQLDIELHESREQLNELNAQNNALTAVKRRIEGELQALHVSFTFKNVQL